MENKYWHNIPDNDDDNEEEELDCMTLAKAKKEQDILDYDHEEFIKQTEDWGDE